MAVVCEKVLRKEKTMNEICSNCQWDMWLDKCLMCGRKKEKKEWVGLTKEEARKICVATVPYVVDMAAAIEAKLKEKNT